MSGSSKGWGRATFASRAVASPTKGSPTALREVRSAGWAWQQGSAQSADDETSPQAGWEVKSVDQGQA